MPADNSVHIYPGSDNLDQFEISVLKKPRSFFRPDVLLLTAPDGVKFVLKDWSQRPALVRNTWCRIAAQREIKVYEQLRGMQNVAQLIAVRQHGFVMEWLDARPLPRRKMRDIMGLEFFDDLSEAVREMHSRGVAHGDLRRLNILRGVDGKPRLIDFETAVRAGKGEGGGRVFKALCRVDQITVLKIKARYFPEVITPAERAMLADVPWHLALGRYIRQNIYAPLTRKGRRRKRRDREKNSTGQ